MMPLITPLLPLLLAFASFISPPLSQKIKMSSLPDTLSPLVCIHMGFYRTAISDIDRAQLSLIFVISYHIIFTSFFSCLMIGCHQLAQVL
jgi:hypothetical protein